MPEPTQAEYERVLKVVEQSSLGSDDVIVSALRLAAKQPWRPISEARRDGTRMLLTDGKEVASGYWEYGRWWTHWPIGTPGEGTPTAWRELPPPPDSDQENPT